MNKKQRLPNNQNSHKYRKVYINQAPIKCLGCDIIFAPLGKREQKFCSKHCRKSYYKQFISRRNKSDLSTGVKGAIGELAVSQRLLLDGWEVFRALSPACSCDLIIQKNGRLHRLEVRSAEIYKNEIHASTYNIRADVIASVLYNPIEVHFIDAKTREPICL